MRATPRGGGSDLPVAQRTYTVTILDVYGDIASARVESFRYIDYLHLARVEGVWQILTLHGGSSPMGSRDRRGSRVEGMGFTATGTA